MASDDISQSIQGAEALSLSDKDIFTFHDDQYHSDFTRRLVCMRDEGMLTDVTLKSGRVSVRCHKVALAAASTYFYQLFNTDQPRNVVELPGVSPNVLEPMIEFIYTANLEIRADLVLDLSRSCDQLQLLSLKTRCDQFISERIRPYNVMGLFMFAQRYHLENSLKTAEKCLLTKPEEILRLALDAEYKSLSQDAFIQWIKNDDLEVPSEDVVFQLVEKWTKADESRTKESCVQDVISYVRLPLCSPDFLVETVNKSSLMNYNSCHQHLDKAKDLLLLKLSGKKSSKDISEYVKPRNICQGMLVLLGGVSNGGANNKCWYLDREDQQWKELTTLPAGQTQFPFHFRACGVKGGIIVTGGCMNAHFQSPTQNVWYYDNKKKTWSALPSMNTARCIHGMLAIGEDVYVFGGNYGGTLTSVEKLDQSRQQWVTLAPMQHAVNFCHALLVGGDIYVISANHGTTQKYSLSAGTWQVMAKVLGGNYQGSMVNVGQIIYNVGGNTATFSYNTQTDTWTQLAQSKQTRWYCYAVEQQGKITVIGGGIGGGSKCTLQSCLSSGEVYDTQTNQWSDSTLTLPLPLGCHAMVTTI